MTHPSYTPKQANGRYLKLVLPAMAVYIAGIFLASFVRLYAKLPDAVVYLVVLIPAAAIFVTLFAMMRFVRETDEYVRRLQVESMLLGLAGVMSVTTAWGLLEFYTQIPKLPIFFALPLFFGFYGLAATYLGWKNGASCQNV